MLMDHPEQLPLFLLGQEGGGPPPAPGEAKQAVDGSASGSGGSGAAPPSGSSPMGGQFFIMMIVLLGGMILFSILATRRDRKKREAMLTAIRKHDRVQTIGGVIGSVVDVKDNTIVLKVDESTNTRITFARSAVQQVLDGDNDKLAVPASRSELEESAR